MCLFAFMFAITILPVPGNLFWNFSTITSSTTFSTSFSLLLPGHLCECYYGWCCLIDHFSYSHFKFVFSFYCSDWGVSIILSSSSLMHLFVSLSLLLVPSSVFFISVIVFVSSDQLFFLIENLNSNYINWTKQGIKGEKVQSSRCSLQYAKIVYL